jgi:4-hydroxy-tetrahydrodipicolinate synthase
MLSGIYSAMVTPFAADGDINEPALRAFIDQGIADGLAGVVVNGGTGEFATLTNAERRRVLEVTADQAAGRFAVIAQTGATSTREAIELSQHAEAHGAVALMLATPYYEPLTFDNVLPYFIDVAKSTSLPIIAYNFAPAMNFDWNVDNLNALLAAVPSVRYLKDSSGATELTVAFRDSDRIQVFNGEDTLVGETLLAGSTGAITGAANVAGPGLVKMHEAARAGDDDTVRNLAGTLAPLFDSFAAGPYNGKIKAVERILGRDLGETRAPYHMPDAQQIAELEAIVANIDPALLTARV